MQAELDQECIGSLRVLAGNAVDTFEITHGDAEVLANLGLAVERKIRRAAGGINIGSRRNFPVNWVVVSPTVATLLYAAADDNLGSFEDVSNLDAAYQSNMVFVGTLCAGMMNVFVDAYATDTTPIIIGKKSSNLDAAAVYAPYVPISSTGVMNDPNTGETAVGFKTRYGWFDVTDATGQSAYLAKIDVKHDLRNVETD